MNELPPHTAFVVSHVNQYLKWAFVEAATGVCKAHHKPAQRHTHRLYERIAKRKGHQTASGTSSDLDHEQLVRRER
jgi:hypothetical protein